MAAQAEQLSRRRRARLLTAPDEETRIEKLIRGKTLPPKGDLRWKALEILTYKRPAGSATNHDFNKKFLIEEIGASYMKGVGNVIKIIPKEDGSESKTLFSCHTDTVHSQGGRQVVSYDQDLDAAYVEPTPGQKWGECLGADNGAGVFILMQMVKAKIPGTYLFHFGEEKGCIGSKEIAQESAEWLAKFDRAVAFDRRNNTSVITKQRSSRCCSDEFGLALGKMLNDACADFKYVNDPTGVWTDTASYTAIIPECTNVSVGYMSEHSDQETLDLEHLMRLRDAVLKVDWEALPTKRNPAEKEVHSYPALQYPRYHGHDYSGYRSPSAPQEELVAGEDDGPPAANDSILARLAMGVPPLNDMQAAMIRSAMMYRFKSSEVKELVKVSPEYSAALLYVLLKEVQSRLESGPPAQHGGSPPAQQQK